MNNPPLQYSVYDAINDYYDIEHKTLFLYHILDEDIFHDTIEKCIKLFDGKEVHKNNVLRYFNHSYKINLLRDKKYSYHKANGTVDEIPLEQTIITCDNDWLTHMDYLKLKKFFYEKFGEDITNLLRTYNLGGYSIKEIEEKSGLHGLHYQFEKMKNAALQAFPDLIEKKHTETAVN